MDSSQKPWRDQGNTPPDIKRFAADRFPPVDPEDVGRTLLGVLHFSQRWRPLHDVSVGRAIKNRLEDLADYQSNLELLRSALQQDYPGLFEQPANGGEAA